MWSRGEFTTTDGQPAEVNGAKRISLATVATYELPDPRRAYDVRPRAPAWGWEVVAYTWTKSIATGSFLAVFAAQWLAGPTVADRIGLAMGLVSLVFLVLTAGLLIADLKQPKRFLYVLLRPQWRSWLVRGAYAITGYGAILTLWLIAKLINAQVLANLLIWPGAILAVISAVYTAFLFAQAKGRDFWQNPLLSLHLLAHALLAGSAVWVLIDAIQLSQPTDAARWSLMGTLIFSVITLLAEILTTPPTTDAHLAMKWIIRRPMGRYFWFGAIGIGHLLPLVILATDVSIIAGSAAVIALTGLFMIEWLWVQAPQQVPLS
jgi:formate-dependent nitrite reductase membrane component NrfD